MKVGDVVKNMRMRAPEMGIIVKIGRPQDMMNPYVIVMTSFGKERWLWDFCEVINEKLVW